MNRNIKTHPAFQNPKILAAREQQLSGFENYIKQQEIENEQIISVYLPPRQAGYVLH
jgi:hypothetical protein